MQYCLPSFPPFLVSLRSSFCPPFFDRPSRTRRKYLTKSSISSRLSPVLTCSQAYKTGSEPACPDCLAPGSYHTATQGQCLPLLSPSDDICYESCP